MPAASDIAPGMDGVEDGTSWGRIKGDMVDSRKLDTKTTGRLGLAVAGALLALALAPVIAQAAPTLTITNPGGVNGSRSVSFTGTTNDSTDPLALRIEGHGAPIEPAVALSGPTTWSAGPVEVPTDGTYKVRVEQGEVPQRGSSETTFVVNTKPPGVSIFALLINQESVVFGGHAGDEAGDGAEVLVQVFEQGASEAEAPLQEIHIVRSGDEWQSEALELPPGSYSARALQEGPPGHPGTSSPLTFNITIKAPTVTLTTPEFATLGGTLVSATATPRFLAEPVAGIGAVRLNVYAGTSAVGSPLEQATMSPSGQVWSATLAQPLANGIYTAQAEVEASSGKGVSAPVIFSVQVPSPATIAPVAPGPSGPTASFTWVPANPAVGQTVSLASNSAGGSSPINAFAWDKAGNGLFVGGGSILTTSFATVGPHIVRLRVSDANGLSSVAQETIGVVAPSPKPIQPFPIVRIAGAETSSGVRVRLLTVQTPLSTKVLVTCKGPGCKTKSESRVAQVSATSKNKTGAVTLAFQRFERPLRAGVILQIRVSKAGQIGKFTGFRIRRHKLPQRTDQCLAPNSSVPIACPVS